MKRQKTARPRADEAPAPPSGAARRRLWLGVSLAAVVALQILGSWSRLDRPFVDSRLHYDYDNADFGFRVRNGLRNHDLRSQFGVTINRYAAWGERTGITKYYTDHPFLFKTLLQLYARAAGVSEWTTRSFYLGVAIATVVGFFALLAQTTRSVWSAVAGAATLAALPLFTVYQVCVKFEADGIAVAVWVFVAFAGYLRRGTRGWRLLYAVLVGAAFLAHWTAILFVVCLAAYQRLPGRSERARELFRTTVWASAAGALALMVLMSYLQTGSIRAVQVLARAFTIRSAPIPLGAWAARQLAFLPGNFTWPLALASLPMVGWLVRHLRRPGVGKAAKRDGPGLEGLRLLAAFIALTFTVACLWLAGFRQGSFIHSYWQYWLCLPIAALVAASVELARPPWVRWIARGLACGLVVWLCFAAQRVQRSVVADQLGTPDDIEFLLSLRNDRFDRLAFVPVAESPLNSWFQGPLFLYYTDRPIVVAAQPGDLRAGDKVLVLRFEQRSAVEQQVEKWAGLQLGNETCGRRICAYDVMLRGARPGVMLGAVPVSYSIDPTKPRVRTRCVGFTTLEETIEHFGELSADPACPRQPDVLLDLREITSLPALEKLRELAHHAASLPGISFRHVAILAVRDDVVGMMRMLQIYGQRAFAATAIFERSEDGEAWLDALEGAGSER